jgi:hypothetical protein
MSWELIQGAASFACGWGEEARGGSIIVGIDAGATTAFAVLDLEGRVVSVKSRKGWGLNEVVEQVSSFKPTVVACDTRPPSLLAKKVASCFRTRFFYPTHSLRWEEKAELTKEFTVKNSHERDALASALKAFHHVENKLRQATRHARREGADAEKVGARVLRGERMKEAVARAKEA